MYVRIADPSLHLTDSGPLILIKRSPLPISHLSRFPSRCYYLKNMDDYKFSKNQMDYHMCSPSFNPRQWPRRLLHVPTMTSHQRYREDTYNGEKAPSYNVLSYTWGRFQQPGPGLHCRSAASIGRFLRSSLKLSHQLPSGWR